MSFPIRWSIDPSSDNRRFFEPVLLAATPYAAELEPSPLVTDGTIHLHLTTDALAIIFAAPSVGLLLLHTSNVDDWLFRLHLLWSLNVGFLHFDTEDGPVPYPIDRHTLNTYRGLIFPAVPHFTNLQFLTRLRQTFLASERTTIWTPANVKRPPRLRALPPPA